ncbi:MAG TPA: hypothetical protein V6C58_11620 [Allocoleopsis sp.]
MNFGYFICLRNFQQSANVLDAHQQHTIYANQNKPARRVLIKIKYQASVIDTYSYSGGVLHLVYIGLYNEYT